MDSPLMIEAAVIEPMVVLIDADWLDIFDGAWRIPEAELVLTAGLASM